jgi:hypothetical protein
MDHPKTAGLAAFLALALGFSPKVSAVASWICLVIALAFGIAISLGIAERKTWSILVKIVLVIGAIVLAVAFGVWLTDGKRIIEDWHAHLFNNETPATARSYAQTVPGSLLPRLIVSPEKLIFKDQRIGMPSNVQTITVTNRGSLDGTISSISAVGDFSQTSDCGSNLKVGDSCSIAVVFTPQKAGLTHGSVDIAWSQQRVNDKSIATVTFSGSGITRKPMEHHGAGSAVVSGSVVAAPCSNVQIGGSGNQATTNCGPITWKLDSKHLGDLTSIFQIKAHPSCVISAAGDSDSKDLARQLCIAAGGTSRIICMGPGIGGYMSALEDAASSGDVLGLGCYADSPNNPSLISVQNSLSEVGLACAYKGVTFTTNNASFCTRNTGTVVVVGSMPAKTY